jgi:hypothetical protein
VINSLWDGQSNSNSANRARVVASLLDPTRIEEGGWLYDQPLPGSQHPKVKSAKGESPHRSYDLEALIQHEILQSLRFPGNVQRQQSISESHDGTFKLIFGDSSANEQPSNSFAEWLRTGSGIYWIDGKPGSGKSTLLKFITDNPLTRDNLAVWPRPNLY